MSEDRLSCSFCGLNKLQTKILVAGQDAHICDQCIEQAFSILNHQNKSNESSFNIEKSELINPKEIKQYLDDYVIGQDYSKKVMEEYDVRPQSPNLITSNFSGGNQQKIILSRELNENPKVLLVGQPTRGVDIGAIEFIHQRLIDMRDRGAAILLVSVELDEVLSLSDRIVVMFDGKIVGEKDNKNVTDRELGLLMAGVV